MTAALALGWIVVPAEAVPDDLVWRLVFPQAVGTDTTINYALHDSGSWQFRGVWPAAAGDRSVPVSVVVQGRSATAARAIILGPAHLPVAIERPLVPATPAEDTIVFVDASHVPVRGRIVDSPLDEPAVINVGYHATWGVSFLQIVDGAAPTVAVGRALVAPDGSFTLSLPDLRHSQVVMSYAPAQRGYFRLRLNTVSESGPTLRLRLVDGGPEELALPAAAEYAELAVTPIQGGRAAGRQSPERP